MSESYMAEEDLNELDVLQWSEFVDRVLHRPPYYARITATVVSHWLIFVDSGQWMTTLVRVQFRSDDGVLFEGTASRDRFCDGDAEVLMLCEGERRKGEVTLYVHAMTALKKASVKGILGDPKFDPAVLRRICSE